MKALLPWVLWVVLIGSVMVILKTPFLRIHTIMCTNQNGHPCPESITAELNKVVGQSSLFYDPEPLIQKLHQALPTAGRLTATVTLPGTLSVLQQDQAIVTNLQTATNSASLLVSQDLTIVGESTPDSTLPVIMYAGAAGWRAGSNITDPPMVFAINLLQSLKDHYIPYGNLTIRSRDEIRVDVGSGKQAVFSSDEDLTRQVTSLQVILEKATMTTDTSVIDVRFEKPVLKPS